MRLFKTLLLVSLMSTLVLSSCGFPGDGVTSDTSIVHTDGPLVVKPTHTPLRSGIICMPLIPPNHSRSTI